MYSSGFHEASAGHQGSDCAFITRGTCSEVLEHYARNHTLVSPKPRFRELAEKLAGKFGFTRKETREEAAEPEPGNQYKRHKAVRDHPQEHIQERSPRECYLPKVLNHRAAHSSTTGDRSLRGSPTRTSTSLDGRRNAKGCLGFTAYGTGYGLISASPFLLEARLRLSL